MASRTHPPIALPPEQLAKAFPFHFAVDWNLQLVQAGASLSRVCPDLKIGTVLDKAFRPIRPEGEFNLGWIRKFQQRIFLLEYSRTALLLRGEFMLLDDQEIVLFLGSPWFTDAAELARLGLRFDDFAIHDPVADMMQVMQASKVALSDAKKYADKLTSQQEELRQVNNRLRLQEAETRKLAHIAAHTTNAVTLTDAEGRIEWVNEGFTRLTEYELSEVAGKKPGEVLQGRETDPTTVQHIREQLRKGEGFSVEIVNYSKSGRKYWLAIEVQPIRDEAGRITNFMAIESDITERKDTERRLREQNALHRAMLEGAGYAIIAANTKGIIQLFNPAAERMLGYTAAEMVGINHPGIFHVAEEVAARARELSAELGREVPAGFEAFVAKSELGQPDQREWTYVRKDGFRFPVLLSVTTLFDERGRVTGYLGVAFDLSERKRNEEKLRLTLSDLERLNRVMMNREERLLELKKEVNQLRLAAGQAEAYESVAEYHPPSI